MIYIGFNKRTKPRDMEKKKLKRDTIENLNALYESREMVLSAFKSGRFPLKPTESADKPYISACVAKASDYSHVKVSTPKQMLQRLPTALAEVKACNTSENLLNQIGQK